MHRKLSVIIVNYNSRDILRDCLKNLQGKYEDMEVIVVDNASKDGSAEMVEANFPTVTLIKTQNRGLAAGSNLGLQKASGDYILFLGSDAFPQEGTLSGMIEYLESHPQVGIATPKLVTRDGKVDMDSHRGFPTPWAALTHFSRLNRLFPKSAVFNQYYLGNKNMTVPHEIDMCIAHFMLVRKSVFDRIGLWDESFFVYGEDVDFCYRTKEAGWQVMYLPQWEARHYKGVSVGIRKETKDISKASEDTKKKMRSSSTEAMRIFYRKHYQKKYPSFITDLVLKGIDLIEKKRI